MEPWMQDYCDAFEEANGNKCTLTPVNNQIPVKLWMLKNAAGIVMSPKGFTKNDILTMTQVLWDRCGYSERIL